ncbi:hypothetical protein, partial [Microcoleus sp. F4-D5]|uniref:hypothetical protein n=1 Tax=Microcoleus sp. F4-D5 TaxID=2818760 RepID=UPI002FD36EE4
HWFSHRMVLDLTFFISSTSLEKWYNAAGGTPRKNPPQILQPRETGFFVVTVGCNYKKTGFSVSEL